MNKTLEELNAEYEDACMSANQEIHNLRQELNEVVNSQRTTIAYFMQELSDENKVLTNKLNIAIEALKKIRGRAYPNGVPSSMIADEALKKITDSKS